MQAGLGATGCGGRLWQALTLTCVLAPSNYKLLLLCISCCSCCSAVRDHPRSRAGREEEHAAENKCTVMTYNACATAPASVPVAPIAIWAALFPA